MIQLIYLLEVELGQYYDVIWIQVVEREILMNEDEFVVEQIELIFELILILVWLNVLHFDLIVEV
jgi:hypothetical protein